MESSSSMESLLAESVEDFLAGHCDLRAVRRIEAGEPVDGLWQQIVESGYADALVPELYGGSGLNLSEAAPIAFACGRHVLPVPLVQTLVVRAGLAEGSLDAPDGPITIAAGATWRNDGSVAALGVPYGMTAQWVLVSDARSDWLLPVASARRAAARAAAGLVGDLHWDRVPASALQWRRSDAANAENVDWLVLAAALTAAQIAGAMERVCEMTIAYANERVQFGKPIGRLQAIQQQISVLAERVAASRCAARIGLSPLDGSSWRADPLRGAVAKGHAAEAVVEVAGIAHAVHGAIGISEEYDLQMLTRHLHEWRTQYGSESYWHARVGAALIQDDRCAARFIQQRIAPPPRPGA
jgi:acyl-CoA dehydrogenase